MYITFATTIVVSLTFCRPGNFMRQIMFSQFFHIMKGIKVVSSFHSSGEQEGKTSKKSVQIEESSNVLNI